MLLRECSIYDVRGVSQEAGRGKGPGRAGEEDLGRQKELRAESGVRNSCGHKGSDSLGGEAASIFWSGNLESYLLRLTIQERKRERKNVDCANKSGGDWERS